MTRFEKEISGQLGAFWMHNARKELTEIQQEFNRGEITVDANGVLRNRINRVAVSEVCEKCKYLGIAFDEIATETARQLEAKASIAAYKEAQKRHQTTDEELSEMRNAFGEGSVVVDVITGRTFRL